MCLKNAVAMILAGCVCAAISAAPIPQQQGAPTNAAADTVSDNLDQVAATAEQILEALNKDPGMMVEFKRELAKDAGNSGQVLDQSDLSDGAISERLRQDLRTRVLAMRLLRRYGYLLPRFNPGSDPAAEHAIVLRERAQEIERAAERRDATLETPQTERTATCDPIRSPECHASEKSLRQGVQPPARRVPNPGRPARPPLTAVDGAADRSYPDEMTAPGGVRTELAQTSARQLSAGATTVAAGRTGSEAADMFPVFADLPPSPAQQSTRPSAGAPEAQIEPVRMERRPNPYADVPSLYDLYVQAAPSNGKLERFGLDVFRNGTGNPDILPMDLPVGPDYVVGPGDSLSIDLWGGVTQRLLRTIDREGRLTLPEVGPVLVSGRTLGEVQREVQSVLRTQFRDVSADVSLLRLRTVRVYVVGEVVSPGAYDISSLSTPLNALFAAGGVTPGGSLRRLEHYRGNKLIEEVDAYDLLLHGIRGDLKRLENGDSLRVPPLGPVVTVDGMVRRPAMYELRGEKNLEEVLELAGGILPAAALRHIEVQRLVAHENRTMLSLEIGETTDAEALKKKLQKFAVQDGDEIHIFPIAPYNESVVYLRGHVLRPGRYSYHKGMRLTDLVSSYKDLLPEPAGRYAEIIRITAPDYRPVVRAFDLAAALAHPAKAPKLEPLDTVRIFGRYDFEPPPEVLVTGAVSKPGLYRTNVSQLQSLDWFLARRREIAATYTTAFEELDELILPPTDSRARPAWHLYVVQLPLERLTAGRLEFFQALRQEGLGVNVHYIPIHLQPYYREKFSTAPGDFPHAEAYYARAISLPMYPAMTDDDVQHVVSTVRQVLRRFRRP
jgi:protein involved in polysaccharide export with SLBB domain